MYSGAYDAKITAKNQVGFPAKHRDPFLKLAGNQRLNLAHWKDDCIYIYTDGQVHNILERIRKENGDEDLQRDLSGRVYPAEMDGQGRFVIPPQILEGYPIGKDVVFWGINDRVEMWEAAKYAAHREKIAREKAEARKKAISTIEGMY